MKSTVRRQRFNSGVGDVSKAAGKSFFSEEIFVNLNGSPAMMVTTPTKFYFFLIKESL